MSISHQEALPLELYHNTVNITTCHISPNQQTKAHGIMHYRLEKGLVFGSSALAENNQQHSNKFYNPYQVNK